MNHCQVRIEVIFSEFHKNIFQFFLYIYWNRIFSCNFYSCFAEPWAFIKHYLRKSEMKPCWFVFSVFVFMSSVVTVDENYPTWKLFVSHHMQSVSRYTISVCEIAVTCAALNYPPKRIKTCFVNQLLVGGGGEEGDDCEGNVATKRITKFWGTCMLCFCSASRHQFAIRTITNRVFTSY
jgi:hypothetical protein